MAAVPRSLSSGIGETVDFDDVVGRRGLQTRLPPAVLRRVEQGVLGAVRATMPARMPARMPAPSGPAVGSTAGGRDG